MTVTMAEADRSPFLVLLCSSEKTLALDDIARVLTLLAAYRNTLDSELRPITTTFLKRLVDDYQNPTEDDPDLSAEALALCTVQALGELEDTVYAMRRDVDAALGLDSEEHRATWWWHPFVLPKDTKKKSDHQG